MLIVINKNLKEECNTIVKCTKIISIIFANNISIVRREELKKELETRISIEHDQCVEDKKQQPKELLHREGKLEMMLSKL